MAAYVEQLECLQCSQSRSFILHGEREQRILAQAEAARVAGRAALTCARCGSGSLIHSWTDAMPYAVAGTAPRRRPRVPLPSKNGSA